MNAVSTTYHYVGPWNARRLLIPRPTDWLDDFASTTILASAVARGMRQHGHFGLA